MNKQEFVSSMADKADLSKKVASEALEAFIETVTEQLAKGDSLALIGFGTFDVMERSARQGRNPRTGEAMQIAASKSPRFKAGRRLRDAVKAR